MRNTRTIDGIGAGNMPSFTIASKADLRSSFAFKTFSPLLIFIADLYIMRLRIFTDKQGLSR